MKKALIGFGGHAREVIAQMGTSLPCFIDDRYTAEGSLPLSTFNPEEYQVMVAVGSSKDRYNIVKTLPANTKYFTFVHPTALVMGDVEIGEGSFIGAYSVLTTNIKIGKHALLSRGNHIGHDCRIGDYFSAMPGAIVSGNVTIDDGVYMGTNSTIREKLTINSLVTIGLNAGVVKNVKHKGTYIGVPAKKIIR
jgi:sugar O-acyltransferase (sialic acid O-acetyltransferase NeuD family)